MSDKLTRKEAIESLNKSLSALFNIKDNDKFKDSYDAIENHLNKFSDVIPKETIEILKERLADTNHRTSHQLTKL